MPYIKPEDRKIYDEQIKNLIVTIKNYTINNEEFVSTAGQMNYIITSLLLGVYGDWLPNYQDINEVIGILECAKQEFYRRTAGPYEDKKIIENGDVTVGKQKVN